MNWNPIGTKWNQNGGSDIAKCKKKWWPGTESNRRRQPFQGCALPSELPGHARLRRLREGGAQNAADQSPEDNIVTTASESLKSAHQGASGRRRIFRRAAAPAIRLFAPA